MDNRRFIARRAAQYFNEGDTVNLGIGIPSACSDYVDPTIAFQTENGMIGVGPVAKKLAICDTYQNAGGINFVPVMGASAFDTAYSFAVIRSGRMAATVLGALQVAENGDIANWASPGRAFGMGGAMDLCNGARKVIVAMELTTKKGEPKGKAVERAWEIARMWKLMSYENRTIMSNLAKRPLKKLLVEDLKLHTVSEQYGSLLRVAAGDLGDEHSAQQDEKYISRVNDYRYATKDMQEPMTAEHWAGMANRAADWFKKVEAGEIENPFDTSKPVKPYRPAPAKKLNK